MITPTALKLTIAVVAIGLLIPVGIWGYNQFRNDNTSTETATRTTEDNTDCPDDDGFTMLFRATNSEETARQLGVRWDADANDYFCIANDMHRITCWNTRTGAWAESLPAAPTQMGAPRYRSYQQCFDNLRRVEKQTQ